MTYPIHTGTISEAEAEIQREHVVQIMAETGCTFQVAVDEYIRRYNAVIKSCDRLDARYAVTQDGPSLSLADFSKRFVLPLS